MSKPLELQEGYESHEPDELSRELGRLLKKYKIAGGVLITMDFANERSGVRSSGESDKVTAAMLRLGDMILEDLANGRYDAAAQVN